MVIKLMEQGHRVEDGVYMWNVRAEESLEESLPPEVPENWAEGSVWVDTTEGFTTKFVLGEEGWELTDPLLATEDDKLYDVSGINNVYVKIEG